MKPCLLALKELVYSVTGNMPQGLRLHVLMTCGGCCWWAQIREMAARGQQFGSHSRNHPSLAGQPIDYLVWQALGSKEAIEAQLGQPPRWVAYPSGKYDARAIAVFRSAGFWGGLTTQQGAEHTLDGIFELQRIRVRGSHTVEDLARLLTLEW